MPAISRRDDRPRLLAAGRLLLAQDAPTDTASTAAATARSTPRFIAWPSRVPAATPRPQNFIIRKKTEGKTQRDPIRCLKRHLARRISVETCVSRIFTKLDLPDIGGEYRRVLAVLKFRQS